METKHWLIEPINEWKQLRGKYNWYTATLIHIYFEKEDIAHGYEFWFTLLGLGFRVRYNTDKSLERFDEWDKEVEEAKQDDTLKVWDSKDLVEHYSDTWTALKDK